MKKTLSVIAVLGIAVITAVSSYASSMEATNAQQDKYKTFVKTSNRCNKSNCSCSGYWGYKHNNGTYEGGCSNTDGHGHTCGHSPQSHGLRAW